MDAKEYIQNVSMHDAVHKELDLIQSVITRMAQNSFYMKGWCITLVAAIFSLSEKVGTVKDIAIPLAIMATFFWVLDTNYLSLEKKYRSLYTLVLKRRLDDDDYGNLYSLDYNLAEKSVKWIFAVRRWIEVLISWSESCLYVPLIILLIGLNFGWWGLMPDRVGRLVRECAERCAYAHSDGSTCSNSQTPREHPVMRSAENKNKK